MITPLFLKRLNLHYKIALCFCSVLILTLSTLWLLIENEVESNLQLQADDLGDTLTQQTADSIRELVLANDLLGLNVVINQLTRNGSISKISVYDVDSNILASAGTAVLNNPIETLYSAEITLQDAVAGSVELELDTSKLIANLNSIYYYFLGTLLFGLLFAIAISLALASHIINPLQTLKAAMQDPDEGSISIDDHRHDEITELQAASKALLEKYQETRSHQMSLSGFSNNNKKPAQSSKLMASLLVIKVVNVNTAIELLHPSTLSLLLNEYYFYLKQAAKLYGGTVQRFSGDSALVSFDTRNCGEEHSFNAVCCAQLFLLLMQRINQSHHAKKSQALQFRLAIHSGETFFTVDSSNEGKQAVLGKTLETCYFLSKRSQPGQLIISETTYSQADVENRLQSSDSIEITMPTDNMSFMAYLLSSNMGSYSELLQKQSFHILPPTD
tara:strand:- start:3935 stop:5269 length:1335 start_codon:yes stop_codon:yes gene_type:complete